MSCPVHMEINCTYRNVSTAEFFCDLSVLCMQVCLCTSTVPGLGYGICAAQRIPQGTWIGPFQGVPLLVDKLQSGAVRNTRHLWEVRGAWSVWPSGCCSVHVQSASVLMCSMSETYWIWFIYLIVWGLYTCDHSLLLYLHFEKKFWGILLQVLERIKKH